MELTLTAVGAIIWKWNKYKMTISYPHGSWGQDDHEKSGGSAQNYTRGVYS